MEEKLLNKIEELNLENIELKKSKQYKKGDDIMKLIEMVKKFQLAKLLKKQINRKKVKKFNLHGELENDFKYDESLVKTEKPKIAVYTCITGQYDKLITPFLNFENIDYIAFTDNKEEDNKVWKIRDIPENIKQLQDNILINRYIKFHPAELFKENYDYAIYIDGNIKVISDLTNLVYAINSATGLAFHRHQFRNCIYNEIEVCRLIGKGNYEKMKKQTQRYRQEGFPEQFGLYECNVIVSDLQNNVGTSILDSWWNEFRNSESYRDQISLPYVVWKNNCQFDDIGSLGNNVYKNPKIRLENHKK